MTLESTLAPRETTGPAGATFVPALPVHVVYALLHAG